MIRIHIPETDGCVAREKPLTNLHLSHSELLLLTSPNYSG
jgi:hypothetical protein